jgi:hypothetical protein
MYDTCFNGILAPTRALTEPNLRPTRRNLMLAPLLGALSAVLPSPGVRASKIDPSETQVVLPDAIKWASWISGFPPRSGGTVAWTNRAPIWC